MARRRVAPSRPLLESGGGGGDRPPVNFGRTASYRRRRRAEREAGTSQQ
jgi:hypothetical protein